MWYIVCVCLGAHGGRSARHAAMTAMAESFARRCAAAPTGVAHLWVAQSHAARLADWAAHHIAPLLDAVFAPPPPRGPPVSVRTITDTFKVSNPITETPHVCLIRAQMGHDILDQIPALNKQ